MTFNDPPLMKIHHFCYLLLLISAIKLETLKIGLSFYPTALKNCWGIVFTHGVWMGGRALGKSLSGLYLRNRKV